MVASAWLFWRWSKDWWTKVNVTPDSSYLSDATYAAAIADISPDTTAPESASEIAQQLAQRYFDSIKALEDKALAVLGVVGGGSSLIALLAPAAESKAPPVTPLLGVAAVSLLGVLLYCLATLWPRRRASVNAERLVNPKLLTSPTGEVQIKAILAREYVEVARSLFPLVRLKARYLSVAQFLFAVGVTAIVANFFLASRPVSNEMASVECKVGNYSLSCKWSPARRGAH